MPKLPPEIVETLRESLNADQKDLTDPARLARLASSIEGAAAPLLAARRRAEARWWELPAAWAATLIPVSLVLAMASLLVLWRVEPPRPPAGQEVAQAPVDQVVNDLVTAPPR